MGHIFISYSRKDSAVVEPIYHRLNRVYNMWIDTRDIEGGVAFGDEIRTQIRSASALIAMVSTNSVNSDWVTGEIAEAQQANVTVIPYVIDHTRTVPIPLQGKNALYGSNPTAEAQLMDALLKTAPDARIHPGKSMTVAEFAQNYRTTFAALAARTLGAVTTQQKNVGIPLKLSRHHTAYLFAHENSTLAPPDYIQIAFQLSGQMPNHTFVDDIMKDVKDYELHEKPYVIVIRSPRKSSRLAKAGEGDSYSMDVENSVEWAEAVNLAYQVVNDFFSKPHLGLYVLGPSILLFQLGTKLRDLWQVDGYHFDRDAKPRARYFKVFSTP